MTEITDNLKTTNELLLSYDNNFAI